MTSTTPTDSLPAEESAPAASKNGKAKSGNALSILDQLHARREEIRESDHLDLPVPRWTDPEIIIRYKPVEHAVIRAAGARLEKAPRRDQYELEVSMNADVLIRGCVAVIARLDGREYSLRPGDPEGPFTAFDQDLARNLGLDEAATAREVVRTLFITDGDVLSHAQSLGEFSGYREAQADEGIAGE